MRLRPRRVTGQRWGLITMVLLLLLSGALVAYGYGRGVLVLPFGIGRDEAQPPGVGSGDLAYAQVDGPVAGTGGPLLRYRVGVETEAGVPLAEFAAAVEAILADPRSWTAGGTLRLQRVSGAAGFDFTVLLASPVLSEAMCREDGLRTQRYTSCRLSDGRVVINSDRWLTGVPDYGAPLVEYRAYVINHEVGHQLGHQHELCPRAGVPAPVMQQQTFGLDGCTPYGWPYRDGQLYTGPLA
jgi:hypothetical protein